MIDPDSDHDTKHVAHLPHGQIFNYVLWAMVFLTISTIWGWSAGWLHPIYDQAMCRLNSAERIDRDIPLSIVVAHFNHDDGEQTKYVMSALSRALDPTIANKDVQIVRACNESEGRRMLQESGARLLVWGEVITKDKVVNISLLPSVRGSARGSGRNYAWTQQMDLDDDFKSDFGMQIAGLIKGMTEPPMLRRRLPLAHGSPGASEQHKGPDDQVYAWAKRIAQLDFMGRGVHSCHMKLGLGYIALTLGYREGLGAFVMEAKQYLTDLKGTSVCLAQPEFVALVHHHLGDLAMSLASWESVPPLDLYIEAVKEYTAALDDQSPGSDPTRRAISLQHLGMAYLRLAEQDGVEKRAAWGEKARRSLERADEVFKAMHNYRAGDTHIAIARLDKLLAAQPPANSQNQQANSQTQQNQRASSQAQNNQAGSQMQPARVITPLISTASVPPPPQAGMVPIGTLSCDILPDAGRQVNVKCEFLDVRTEKREIYVGSISTSGANITMRLAWFVYVPGGQSYSKLTGTYQVQGAAPGEYLLAKSTRRSVALRPEHPSDRVGKLDLKTGR